MRIATTPLPMKRHLAFTISAFAVIGIFLLQACHRDSRPSDSAEIRANYANFRDAIIAHDLDKANELLASSYQRSSPPDKLFVTFQEIAQPKTELSSNSWVDFKSRDRAFLYPQSKPTIGAIAYEFIRTTNGWLLTGNWMYVVH
jgi:hypothetical protein